MTINYNLQPNFFKINGVSCKDMHLWCNTLPAPQIPKMKVQTFSVGSEENKVIFDDEYEDIPYKITCFSFDNTDYSNVQLINAYFLGAKTLEISRLTGVYFKVKDVSVNVDTSFKGSKLKYTVAFKLSPFKYAVSNDEIELENGQTIVNNGSIFSRPIIEIHGSMTATITCNGVDFVVDLGNNLGVYVIADSEKLVTYDKSTNELLQNRTSGLYPLLAPGNNVISWTNTAGLEYIQYVSIIKNERYL
jgi:phage-related protein